MPMNGFNVGRDISVQIVGYDGTIKSFALLTGFDSKQNTNKVSIKAMDGIVRFLEIPDGWDGTFEYERQDDTIDSYFANLEAGYYGGQNIQSATITETITQPDGSNVQYRFTGVMFKLDDAGSWKGDQSVKLKLSWCASRRLKVA